MTADDIARVLLALEHDDMTRDDDHRFQSVCAHLAPAVTDPDLSVRLERAAITCHHCNAADRQGSEG